MIYYTVRCGGFVQTGQNPISMDRTVAEARDRWPNLPVTVIVEDAPILTNEILAEIWNRTVESQFDCDWDELSEDGADQVARFAKVIREY